MTARLAVLVKGEDRPGLLQRVSTLLTKLGANIVTSMGYSAAGTASMLFLVESELDRPELGERLRRELKDLELEVTVAEVGPEAGLLLADFVSRKLGMLTVLEGYLEPADIYEILVRLERDLRLRAYKLLSIETLADIVDMAPDEIVREILDAAGFETFSRILQKLDPDEAVDVLQKLPEEHVRRLLLNLPREYRIQASELLRYPPDTAGGIMTKSVPVLPARSRVRDALAEISRGDYDVRDVVVVVGENQRLVGLAEVVDLLRYGPDEILERIAVRPRVTVEPQVDREEVAVMMLRYHLRHVPVVDGEGRFLGLVVLEDVAYVLSEEAAEDLAKIGGILDAGRVIERYFSTPLKELVKSRLVWLLLIYFIQSVTANVIKGHTDLIERVAVVAAFIPLIMDTGGNVGSQASSMMIRALALREISEHSTGDVLKVLLRELAAASVLGAVFSTIGFAFAYFVSGGELMVALAVAVTLMVVTLFADIVGALLPILAKRAGVDPASVSAPLITTIVDITVAFVYMSISYSLLF
jgi:magnesium transporter